MSPGGTHLGTEGAAGPPPHGCHLPPRTCRPRTTSPSGCPRLPGSGPSSTRRRCARATRRSRAVCPTPARQYRSPGHPVPRGDGRKVRGWWRRGARVPGGQQPHKPLHAQPALPSPHTRARHRPTWRCSCRRHRPPLAQAWWPRWARQGRWAAVRRGGWPPPPSGALPAASPPPRSSRRSPLPSSPPGEGTHTGQGRAVGHCSPGAPTCGQGQAGVGRVPWASPPGWGASSAVPPRPWYGPGSPPKASLGSRGPLNLHGPAAPSHHPPAPSPQAWGAPLSSRASVSLCGQEGTAWGALAKLPGGALGEKGGSCPPPRGCPCSAPPRWTVPAASLAPPGVHPPRTRPSPLQRCQRTDGTGAGALRTVPTPSRPGGWPGPPCPALLPRQVPCSGLPSTPSPPRGHSPPGLVHVPSPPAPLCPGALLGPPDPPPPAPAPGVQLHSRSTHPPPSTLHLRPGARHRVTRCTHPGTPSTPWTRVTLLRVAQYPPPRTTPSPAGPAGLPCPGTRCPRAERAELRWPGRAGPGRATKPSGAGKRRTQPSRAEPSRPPRGGHLPMRAGRRGGPDRAEPSRTEPSQAGPD